MTILRALGLVDEALDGAIATLSAGDRRLALGELHRARRELGRARALADPRASAPDGAKSSVHDLRGMLSAIAGWAQLLQLEDCDPATVVRASEAIERNAKALTAGLQRFAERDDRRSRRARGSSAWAGASDARRSPA